MLVLLIEDVIFFIKNSKVLRSGWKFFQKTKEKDEFVLCASSRVLLDFIVLYLLTLYICLGGLF